MSQFELSRVPYPRTYVVYVFGSVGLEGGAWRVLKGV